MKSGEPLQTFVDRLIELFADLEGLEGEHAMTFNGTQRLASLLTAIRKEPDLKDVFSYIQGEQTRGKMAFELACETLIGRCDAETANQALDDGAVIRRKGYFGQVGETNEMMESTAFLDWAASDRAELKAFITTANKRRTPAKRDHEGTQCVVQGCT
jgi:hypothetical protein